MAVAHFLVLFLSEEIETPLMLMLRAIQLAEMRRLNVRNNRFCCVIDIAILVEYSYPSKQQVSKMAMHIFSYGMKNNNNGMTLTQYDIEHDRSTGPVFKFILFSKKTKSLKQKKQ